MRDIYYGRFPDTQDYQRNRYYHRKRIQNENCNGIG